jgi:uncharacterized membrane protein
MLTRIPYPERGRVAVDKNRSQLYVIIVGLFFIATGIYLNLIVREYTLTLFASTALVGGIVILISGIRYKEMPNAKVLEGEERAAYARSNYIISMTGTVIFFAGLGGGYFATHMNATPMIIWFLIIAFVGGLLIVVGRFLKKDTYGT